MNAFRGLQRGVVPEAEQAWLFKIAENVCLSRRRSSWRRGRVESPNDFEVLQEIVPSQHNRRADELIGLEDALEAMPENQRRAILLREWQGLSYREISEELELSQAAVETLIFRARRSLAQGLEQPPAPKKGRLRRAGQGLNLGSLIAGLKSLATGGAAVKAVAVAVAAGTATVAATETAPLVAHHHHAAKFRVPAVSKQFTAEVSPQTSLVAGVTGLTVAQAQRQVHPVVLQSGFRAHGKAAAGPAAETSRSTSPPPLVPSAPAPAAPAAPAAPVTPTAPPAPAAPSGGGDANPTPAPAPPHGGGDGQHSTPARPQGADGSHAAAPANPKKDAPKADAPGNGHGNPGGNGNGHAKGNAPKANTPKADPPGAAPATPQPADAPATANAGGGNGNPNAADKGNGNDKKSDPAQAPAPPAPAASTPSTPPAPTANPPQHGNGNGNGNGNGADKGKGK